MITNAHQAERVRSYLRGRLQRIINPTAPLGSGQYLCHSKGAGISFGSPDLDRGFAGTLPEIAAHFNVEIPDSIMKGLVDGPISK